MILFKVGQMQRTDAIIYYTILYIGKEFGLTLFFEIVVQIFQVYEFFIYI
jgi:hypothetical protein